MASASGNEKEKKEYQENVFVRYVNRWIPPGDRARGKVTTYDELVKYDGELHLLANHKGVSYDGVSNEYAKIMSEVSNYMTDNNSNNFNEFEGYCQIAYKLRLYNDRAERIKKLSEKADAELERCRQVRRTNYKKWLNDLLSIDFNVNGNCHRSANLHNFCEFSICEDNPLAIRVSIFNTAYYIAKYNRDIFDRFISHDFTDNKYMMALQNYMSNALITAFSNKIEIDDIDISLDADHIYRLRHDLDYINNAINKKQKKSDE